MMLVASEDRMYWWDGGADSAPPALRLEQQGIRRVAEGATAQIATLEGDELLLLSGEERVTLNTGIQEPVHSLVVVNESPFSLLVGTEPPYLYRVSISPDLDSGPLMVARSTSFDALSVRDAWHTPWGGPPALRSMAVTQDGRAYADIHVGSIMRSPDGGVTWEPVTPQLHEDVHQVATSPASNERVYANTYLAVYVSDDRGETWTHRAAALGQRYGRAMAVHPRDPDIALAAVSDGPHGGNVHGQLFRTEDAGRTWAHVQGGFPASTQRNIDTFHVAFGHDGTAWAIVDDTLFIGRDDGRAWDAFWTAPQPLNMIACCAR